MRVSRVIIVQIFLSMILVIIPLFSRNFLYAQTGPGGVGNSATNTLWLDAHTMGGSNGSAISAWTDYSGNGVHGAQPIITKRPVYVTGAVNGRDAIDFNGTQNLNCGATATMNNATFIDWYVIGELDNTNILSIPFNVDYGTPGALDVFTGFLTQSGLPQSSYSHNAIGHLIKANFPVTSGYNLYQGQYNRTAHTVNSRVNFTTNATNVNNYYNSATHEGYNIGGKNTAYRMDGRIAEVFVFKVALNTAENKIVQNYINAKYGTPITVADMYTYDGTHGLGVVGIGQDDASNQNIAAQGNGVVLINNATNLENGEYLFIGHDDEDLSAFNTTDIPATMINGTRFERTWRVAKTGNLGNVDITFDLDPSTDFSAANPSEYRLLIDGSGVFVTADQELTGTYNAGTNSITFTNVDLSDGDYFTLAGESPDDIHSITSGDWSDPNTWDCTCVPSSLNNVFIEPTDIVEVDVDASCLTLNVDGTASLTMNSGSNLDIYQDLNLYGTFVAGSGQISFVGTTPQFFDDGGNGITLFDLNIDNSDPSGVTIFATDLILDGTLTMTQGLLDLTDSGMNFIINSTSSTGGGRVAAIPVGSTISGSVTVRRFIPSGISDWRDLCSPVVGATFNSWDPDIIMGGPSFPDGCAVGFGDPCFKSVRYTVNGIQANVLNVNDPITNGRGFYLWLGDDLNSFGGATLSSTGTLNGTADIPKSLNTGWHTIGNPYASPMLYSATTRTSQISNYFYVYDNTIGDYQYYDGSTGLGSIPEFDNGLMATGQGIWVYATSIGTITFHQTDKTASTATYIRSSELESANKTMSLVLKQEGTTYQTSVMFEMNPLANDGLDSLADMRYLEMGHEMAPRLYMSYTNGDVRKNFIREDLYNKSFELYSKFKNAGYYNFSIENIAVADKYLSVLIYDNQTGEFIDLKKEPTYVFYSDVFEGQRFTLILTNEVTQTGSTVESLTINETENGINLVQMGHTFDLQISNANAANASIQVINLLGQTTVYNDQINIEEGSNLFNLPADLKGVHIIRVSYGNEIITKKVVL